MKFGKQSLKNLCLLSYNLQWVARETLALEIIDFTIKCTFRNEQDQNEAYYATPQRSRAKWPEGKHNKVPALAMDCVPYINGRASWNKLHCCVLAGVMLAAAKKLGIPLRWGGNWDMDYEPITDQDFNDLCHFEEV